MPQERIEVRMGKPHINDSLPTVPSLPTAPTPHLAQPCCPAGTQRTPTHTHICTQRKLEGSWQLTTAKSRSEEQNWGAGEHLPEPRPESDERLRLQPHPHSKATRSTITQNTPNALCIFWHPSGHTIASSSQAEAPSLPPAVCERVTNVCGKAARYHAAHQPTTTPIGPSISASAPETAFK
eukprot:superscaffoldBa00003443_g16955